MRELREILLRTVKNLDAFSHPRVSIAWQDRDLIYRRVHNPSPDLGLNIIGKRLEDIIGDSQQARSLTVSKQRVLNTGRAYHQVTEVKLGRRIHVIDLSIEPTYDETGAMDGLISVNIDVTDLAAARKRLQEANERLVRLLDQALGEVPVQRQIDVSAVD